MKHCIPGVRGIQVPPLAKCSREQLVKPIEDKDRIWVSQARIKNERKEKQENERLCAEKARKKVEKAKQHFVPNTEEEDDADNSAADFSQQDSQQDSQQYSQNSTYSQRDPDTQDYRDIDETYDDYNGEEAEDSDSLEISCCSSSQNASAAEAGFTIPEAAKTLCSNPYKRKLVETGNFVPPSALQTQSDRKLSKTVAQMRSDTPPKIQNRPKGRLSLSQNKKSTKQLIVSTFNNPINISLINREGSTPRFQASCEDGDEDLQEMPDDSNNDPTYSPTKDVDNGEEDDGLVSDDTDLPTHLNLMRTSSSRTKGSPQPSTSRNRPLKKYVSQFQEIEAAETSASKHVPAFLKEEMKVQVKRTSPRTKTEPSPRKPPTKQQRVGKGEPISKTEPSARKQPTKEDPPSRRSTSPCNPPAPPAPKPDVDDCTVLQTRTEIRKEGGGHREKYGLPCGTKIVYVT